MPFDNNSMWPIDKRMRELSGRIHPVVRPGFLFPKVARLLVFFQHDSNVNLLNFVINSGAGVCFGRQGLLETDQAVPHSVELKVPSLFFAFP